MIAPRFSDQPFPVRRVGPRAADGSAPGEGSSSRPSPGAGHCSALPARPDFSVLTIAIADPVQLCLRLAAAHHGVSEDDLVARLIAAHAEEIGIARLTDASQARAPP